MDKVQLQIKKLKEQYNTRKYQRVEQLYNILKKIVSLKQKNNPNYRPRSLEREKDLKINSNEIRFIFAFEYLSSKTKQLIKQRKITDVLACRLVQRSGAFNSDFENKLINYWIDKKLTSTELHELTKSQLFALVNNQKLSLKDKERVLVGYTKTIRNITSKINKMKNIVKQSDFSRSLFLAVKNLDKTIKNLSPTQNGTKNN